MKSGNHQIEVDEDNKERTTFTLGLFGLWEFNKMPFGLNNSPATYQRLMTECLGDVNMNICVVYIDDLIIFSKTFKEHFEHLKKVVNRLKSWNFKFSSRKMPFIL